MLSNIKKKIIASAVALVLVSGAWLAYSHFASPTRIALLNFQPFQTTSIVLSNDNKFVRYEEVPYDQIASLGKYDCVLAFGMGLRLTTEQRKQLLKVAGQGTPLLVFSATSPENNINNLDSITSETLSEYLGNGSKKNYRNMARYIRTHIDGKTLFTEKPEEPVESADNVYYDLGDEAIFSTLPEYEKYLKKNGLFIPGAPKVALIGGINDPFSGNRDNIDSIITSFRRAGMNVYPVESFAKRLHFLQEISPDAVVYFAHGRIAMGHADAATQWLKQQNIPLFAPLNMLISQKEWEADPMGMFGGFLSQSVVMPEIDGGIYPYVISVQEKEANGLSVFKAVPERLKKFTAIVHNFISLKKKANADKKIALFYFKGPGLSALAAQGLEIPQSIYTLLKRLKKEGYRVDNLPASERAFEKLLMGQGAVFSTYAEGAFDDYLKNGNPLLVEKTQYEKWAAKAMPASLYAQVREKYGEAPGSYMRVSRNDSDYIAIACIRFGNIALLPQPMPGLGDDSFAIIHGAKTPPPHSYIAPYLWVQYGFRADAMIHFGTHGSLEFTPQKQVALSDKDWPEVLVGTLPHFYYYTIGNIGESVMAKRRSYATIVSYLTPAFSESKTRAQYRAFTDAVNSYYKIGSKGEEALRRKASLRVKKIAVEMGLHRELRMDSVLANPYSEEEIERLENFAEEIATEKTTGTLYVTGVPYSPGKIESTVMAMSADPIAYSLAALDRERGKVSGQQLKHKTFFTAKYLNPAKQTVKQLLDKNIQPDSNFVARIAGISTGEIARAHSILAPPRRKMAAMMQAAKHTHPQGANTDKEKEKARARLIVEIERSITNVQAYKKALQESPEMELKGFVHALAGGYVAPSSGGDPVANPKSVPTGRNLYSVNAEATPSEAAWDKGVMLANATIEQYRKQHKGEYPRKVSYTFWSSEFIESEGATIAQVLYMLGVEPVRDGFGRVSDLQLIPSQRLARPRIDVVVQTSGQFRDIAASRLDLVSRAVQMAAKADDGKTINYVKQSTVETERLLVEEGVPPNSAREMSVRRVFGGINGMYGTGIQKMITSSDRWKSEKEIAEVYLNNMGAVYGDKKTWGEFDKGLLRAVLHNTDVLVQPRQSNTWGPLSLDHVYEFMGGMNLTIRNVTGKDPDAYFADYRNRNNVRMQDVKEAIGVEARSTIFNPEYLKEVVKGGQSAAARIEDVATNIFGWNVARPEAIDNEMWDKFYNIYVKDEYKLGIQKFFERENPASLQEVTAIMLEAARKGMWKATGRQIADIASLHADLVNRFGANGMGFSGGNKKLQEFIAAKTDTRTASLYLREIKKTEQPANASESSRNGVVLKKEALSPQQQKDSLLINGSILAAVVLIAFAGTVVLIRRRRKKGGG